MSPAAYEEFIASATIDERIGSHEGTTLVIVRGATAPLTPPASLPVIVCAVGERFGGDGPSGADLVVADNDVDDVVRVIEQCPLAATTLALLLRTLPGMGAEHGLVLESVAYSMLQGAPEFAEWRHSTIDDAERARRTTGGTDADERGLADTVVVRRRGDELDIILNRPHRHNAVSARLRDDLHAALLLASVDDSIRSVHLRGNGPSFCSGGDLAEFGQRPDPATAHVTRLARSPARVLDTIGDRATAWLHGYALGGGIEMAAFASRVVADPATTIGLPEVEYGLIPGAGGTVSVLRRVGRQRTAALALSGRKIDAATALAWRLVDHIAPVRPADAPTLR